jgi:hypothetical protein
MTIETLIEKLKQMPSTGEVFLEDVETWDDGDGYVDVMPTSVPLRKVIMCSDGSVVLSKGDD